MIELPWNQPLSEAKLARVIAALPLEAGQRVLDVGCGAGEVLLRVHERHGVGGVGIDRSEEHLEEARRRAEGRVPESAVRFEVADASEFPVEPTSFELVMCLGSTHAFGLGPDAYENALRRMRPMVVPGGSILVAEGFARQPADPEYRQRCLGETTPDSMTHAANVETGRELGLVPLAAWTSTKDEWDEFEWSYQRIVEQRAADRPEDEGAQSRLRDRRDWMEAYLRWGRDTLGYGVYLFRCA